MENKKQTIPQFKAFFIQMYEEPTKELLIALGVKEYSYILHDKDVDENGEVKKAHYHLFVSLNKKKTENGVRKIVNTIQPNSSQDFLINSVTSIPSCIRYLIHIDDKEKYQYSINEVVTNMELKPFFDLEIADSVFISMMLQLCESGEFKHFREMVKIAIQYSKLDLLMSKAYFFKSLI